MMRFLFAAALAAGASAHAHTRSAEGAALPAQPLSAVGATYLAQLQLDGPTIPGSITVLPGAQSGYDCECAPPPQSGPRREGEIALPCVSVYTLYTPINHPIPRLQHLVDKPCKHVRVQHLRHNDDPLFGRRGPLHLGCHQPHAYHAGACLGGFLSRTLQAPCARLTLTLPSPRRTPTGPV